MQLMERFLAEKETWAILPVSAVRRLKETRRIKILPMRDGPDVRVTYLLLKNREDYKEPLVALLGILKEELERQEIRWLAEDFSSF